MQGGLRPSPLSALLICITASSALTPHPPPLSRWDRSIHPATGISTQPAMFLDGAPNLDEQIAVALPAPERPKRPSWSPALTNGVPAGLLALLALRFAGPTMGSWYSTLALQSPLACSIGTAGLKGVTSDLFAQFAVERRRSVERRRTLAFCSFNMLYIGAFGWYKYNHLYNAIFGTAKTLPVIAAKVTTDLGAGAPLIYFPAYFIIKGLFAGHGPLHSLRELSAQGWSLLRRYWAVWFPVEILMWMVVPAHLRVAFLCSVSLVWQVALSTMTMGGSRPEADSPSTAPPPPGEHHPTSTASTAHLASAVRR